MPIQFNSVAADWTSWSPGSPTGINTSTVGREIRIRWGTPITNSTAQSGYGFLPLLPPIQFLKIGDRFRLGRLRHFNHPINGTPITAATLEILVDFADAGTNTFNLDFTHDETLNTSPGCCDDHVTFTDALPIVLTHNGIIIHVLGFEDVNGDPVAQFDSPEGTVNTAYLIAVLVDDGVVEEECTNNNRVFSPEKCTVPCVLPIAPFDIINDCAIPAAPEAIGSCPDIGVPLAQQAAQNVVNQAVDVTTNKLSDVTINKLIQQNYITLCDRVKNSNIVFWIWCACFPCDSETPDTGGDECSYSGECDDPPGKWINACTGQESQPGEPPPPCWQGRMYGEVAMTAICTEMLACELCAYWSFDEVVANPATVDDIAKDATGHGWYLQPSPTVTAYSSTATSLHGGQARYTTGGYSNNGMVIGGYSELAGRQAPECCFLQSGSVIWGWFRSEVTMVSEGLGNGNNWLAVIASGPDWYVWGEGGSGVFADIDSTIGKFNLQIAMQSVTFAVTTPIDITELDEDVWYFLAMWVDRDTNTFYVRLNNTIYTANIPWTLEDYSMVDPSSKAFGTAVTSTIIYGPNVDTWAWLSEEWGIANGPLTTGQLNALYNAGAGVNYSQALTIVRGY